MKMILNKCYGGFRVNDEWAKIHGVCPYDEEKLRYNETLIKAIEDGEDVNGTASLLRVITIPDETTDYKLTEYDGIESIVYVVDGKLHWA